MKILFIGPLTQGLIYIRGFVPPLQSWPLESAIFTPLFSAPDHSPVIERRSAQTARFCWFFSSSLRAFFRVQAVIFRHCETALGQTCLGQRRTLFACAAKLKHETRLMILSCVGTINDHFCLIFV